ncbi:MAG: hypothetical protein ACXADB_13595 [Candidatus Hermodarchaeia archaeon]|jgi:hypothetical protein
MTIALSKNKRTQPLYRSATPTRPIIIVAFDHQSDLDDSIYVSQVVDESLDVELEDEIELEVTGEIDVEYDDTGLDMEVCGDN